MYNLFGFSDAVAIVEIKLNPNDEKESIV